MNVIFTASSQPCSSAVSVKTRLALARALSHSGKHFGCADCSSSILRRNTLVKVNEGGGTERERTSDRESGTVEKVRE